MFPCSLFSTQTADLYESVLGAYLANYGVKAAFAFLRVSGLLNMSPSFLGRVLDAGTRESHLSASRRAPAHALPAILHESLARMAARMRYRPNPFSHIVPERPLRATLEDWAVMHAEMMASFRASNLFACGNLLRAHQMDCIEKILEYRFECPVLLGLSLYKNSVYDASGISFERLEYLGDSVLDYVITCTLMQRYTGDGPGDLTLRRQRVVSNKRFARVLDRTGILRVFHSTGPVDPAVPQPPPPERDGAIFESLVGAVFFDANFSVDVVWRVFGKWLLQNVD
jgi:hypothetical protein